jgi:glycolate oxidase FAD binding subunit
MEPVIAQFQDHIREAVNHRQTLKITGGDTKYWYGDHSQGKVLSTLGYHGILDYQPEELVITVRSGTLLAEVEEILKSKQQYFPFEPPHFGEKATIGGMIASGLAGPGRAHYGSLRDFVLGVSVMDGTGQILSFGGKVMKNVAGFDVSRLIPSSLGTLSLLLDVSIKVLPIPAKTQTLQFNMPQSQAITQMNTWASQPLPLSASAWSAGTLTIRLAGAVAAVNAAIIKMSQTSPSVLMDDPAAHSFWMSIREQTHSFFQLNANESLWRFAINPLAEPLPFQHETMIEWLGGQRWVKGKLDATQAQELAKLFGGHATLFRGVKPLGKSVFTPLASNPLSAPLQIVEQRIKKTFDPHGIFQTGRMPF